MMRIALLSLVISAAMVIAVAAEESGNLQSAQSSLDYTLSTLHNSVAQLTRENQELASANERLREQLASLQNSLSVLQRDDSKTLEQFSAAEGRYKKKMLGITNIEKQIAGLREEEARLNKQTVELSRDIASHDQVTVDVRALIYKKETELQAAMAEPAEKGLADVVSLTATRDKLQAQSRVSADLLQRTREEWLELQSVVQGGPERVEVLKNNKRGLAQALAAKEADCVKLAENLTAAQQAVNDITDSNQISSLGIASLEQEVRFLNNRYRGLEKEFNALQRGEEEKARKVSEAESSERSKMEAKLKETALRNKALQAELDQLRRQMVELDKKKSLLERAVYGNN